MKNQNRYNELSKRNQADVDEFINGVASGDRSISELDRQEIPDTKHNGWTNYATWRVNLEVFDGYDPDGTAVEADALQELAEELILIDESLVSSYAMAFLSDVNWHEIAEGINEAYELAENKGARI